MESMNIYQRMSKATEKIKTIPKNLTVGTGKSQYKAVAEKDILAAVKEAESEFGIYSYPAARQIVESKQITTKNDYGEKELQFVRIESTYRFVNIEDPKDFVEVIGYGDGIDSLDKAPGKAITYADKYAIMKAFKIETGDDLDASASDDLSGHDIYKIKQRVEQIVTDKINRGMDLRDICAALGISEKQFNTLMNYYVQLGKLEASLRKND